MIAGREGFPSMGAEGEGVAGSAFAARQKASDKAKPTLSKSDG
jgi:hypothetical protein